MAVLAAAPEWAWAQEAVALPGLLVTASRLGYGGAGAQSYGIAGTSTTVVTAQDIARSPAQSVQDILAREAGIQVQSLFGGVAGARTSVDLRGFGAAATSNTLVLVNGRRLNDIDMAGVDFTAIPRESIERIEITRGNSGAVLYGDNAVGGVINIVTKSGVGRPASLRLEGGAGSFRLREGAVSANRSSGPFSASVFGNAISSDGYRVNNALRQYNGVGELRYEGERTSAYLNLSGDDQHLGLPGARRVTATSSELVTNRRGTSTPFDFADKQGINATLGVTHRLGEGAEIVVDGGVRHKAQQAGFFVGGFPQFDRFVDATLTAASFTPRIYIDQAFAMLPARTIIGFDFYQGDYQSDRSVHRGDRPVHRYDLTQTSYAGYAQTTIALTPRTDIALGARVQNTNLKATDRFDMTAPGGAFDAMATPLDKGQANHALHVGIEHRLVGPFTLFARAARSFRTPNVDERLALRSFPTNFDLQTQTSYDVEGGARVRWGGLDWQTSAYLMDLRNEIHFRPDLFANVNLDPTRRHGVETSATYQLMPSVRLRGAFAYTRAKFRAGPFAGNDVPLVSRSSGSAGAAWDIWHKYVVLDAQARFVDTRRLDNDQRNVQPLIPAHAILDLRLGGEIEKFFWSLAVLNVFDSRYFDYGVASAFTIGTFNAYPQPGRHYAFKAGAVF
ncbi:MAG: TonB-dependent receptor [Proteobacteria bacterium]|nr:TonB-dependent receptor [Pseudomonadota bacterium]